MLRKNKDEKKFSFKPRSPDPDAPEWDWGDDHEDNEEVGNREEEEADVVDEEICKTQRPGVSVLERLRKHFTHKTP